MATNNLIGPDLLTTCTNANSLLMLKKLLSRFTKEVFHHHFDQHKSREQQWRSVMPSSHIKLIIFIRWEPLMAPQWRNYQLDIFFLCTNLVSWGHLEDRRQLKNHKRSKLVLIIITFSLWMLNYSFLQIHATLWGGRLSTFNKTTFPIILSGRTSTDEASNSHLWIECCLFCCRDTT